MKEAKTSFKGIGFNVDLSPNPKYPELNAFTFGIDNLLLCKDGFGFQMYDYDSETLLPKEVIDKILTIFPDDCQMFRTEHGFHFVSFRVIDYETTLLRVRKLAEIFPEQDYNPKYNLTLRIAPKFSIKDLSIISKAPKFYMELKEPSNTYEYAFYPLMYYFKHLGLPTKIFVKYHKFKYLMPKYHIYRTRYNTKK